MLLRWPCVPTLLLLLACCPAVAQDSGPRRHSRITFHASPAPRAPGAIDQDWTHFLGPTHDAVSAETRLLKRWPARGPRLVWSFDRGSGYASPAIQGDRLVLLHRVANHVEAVCLQRETGVHYWTHRWPTRYRDRFNFSDGPRSSPVIDGDRVYVYGAQFRLFCLSLASGKVLWQRDMARDYKLSEEFFGNSTTPLVEGGLLVLNIGAPGGPNVVALNKQTGAQVWGVGKKWGRSYASPVPATIHGKRRVLVFAGGESDPAHGGLLCIDPARGTLDFRVPWRSKDYTSVNAANPVVRGNQVLVSASYGTGSALITINEDFSPSVRWKTRKLGVHWNTPIVHGDQIYGFDGRHSKKARLVCLDWATGKQRWRDQPTWKEGAHTLSPFRGNLLWADGDFLCLGERGHLLWLKMNPGGVTVLARARLFDAPGSWSTPVLSRGLLYLSQHHTGASGSERLYCYDLRGR